MKPSGSVLFQDEFDQQYRVEWRTVGDAIDLTSSVATPFVWGESASGYVKDGILFRNGIVTITRQILKPLADGYEIVAEGSSQYEDDIQMNFPCQVGPIDTFAYHINHPIVDDLDMVITDGSHWADITGVIWCDLDVNGDPVSVSDTVLEFVDVWG